MPGDRGGEGEVLVALGLGPGATEEEVVAHLCRLGGLPVPQLRVTRALLARLVPCIKQGLIDNALDLYDDAEAAHYVLSCAVAPLSEEDWRACRDDLHIADLDHTLRMLLIDRVVPRLDQAGLVELWPPPPWKREILAALGLGPQATEEQVAAHLSRLGGLPVPQLRVTHTLLARFVPCIKQRLIDNSLDVFAPAEAAHYVLSCAVAPLSEEDWRACRDDLRADDLDHTLRALLIDCVLPRLGQAGLVELWPPQPPD